MKTLLAVTVAMLAISVPVAFGDTPPPSSIQTTPSGQTQGQDQRQDAGARIEMIRMRLALIEKRFDKRCGTSSANASQECVDFAKKAADRLAALHTRLQALIAKRQQAGKDVEPLTKLDAAVQALAAKIHTWLGT